MARSVQWMRSAGDGAADFGLGLARILHAQHDAVPFLVLQFDHDRMRVRADEDELDYGTVSQ